MTDYPRNRKRFPTRAALDQWALAIATALIVLIIAGVLPHRPW